MSDTLGPVPIPDPPVIDPFPLLGDYGSGIDFSPPVATHVFDQPGLKIEQRYLLGSGVRRFRVVRARGLACNEHELLKAHFEQARGSYAQFLYTFYTPADTTPDGAQVTTCRYENPNITFDHLVGMLRGDPGVTLLEVPAIVPSYTSAGPPLVRFPDSALTAALENQVQQFIPLIKVTPRDSTMSDPLYLSNQRCTVDGQLYLPRVLDWGGISQTLSDTSDSATFTFGNADDVFTKLVNQASLYRAVVQFSLFHVNTSIRIDFWMGYGRPWSMTSDGKFVLPTSDGVFELGIAYPSRQLTRMCWKVYRGRFCPASASNGFPDCPKSYEACVARGVPKSFGGVVGYPQTVHVKDNSTGVFGWSRSSITSVSSVADNIYQRPVQEVYTDRDMLVVADVTEARDESEFFSALGIVGEGPIGAYSTNLVSQTLDGKPPHDPQHNGGWRGILGNDPAAVSDFFGIDQDPWNVPPPDSSYAAGLAFAEIRCVDEVGRQLSAISEHNMKITVSQGISGWTWTAPGERVWTSPLTNTVWVAINVYLRGLGLKALPINAADMPAAEMEKYFDVDQAIAMAAICELPVDKLVGSGTERQFPFRGVLKEQKPLKDWLQEILNCCLGFYAFVNGKLWIGIRENSGVLAGNDFTQATILYQSLQATPVSPQFNWLNGEFGDEEFNWQTNTVAVYDIDAASLAGTGQSPQYTQSTMSLVGVSNKSECARIISTRLREELGGVGLTEQRNARHMQFRTTLLAMRTMVGDIIAVNSPRLPGSPGRCEGRVQKWTLNPDFSIDITTSATTDAMYDLTFGPKPEDVPSQPVPPEILPPPEGLAWMPDHIAPFADDPMYPDPAERSFDLWQEYDITRDGVWAPVIAISGDMVVNRFVLQVQPRIVGIELVAGGALAGPMIVYVAVTQHDPSGLFSVPSNLNAVWIPVGATGQAVTIELAPAPTGPWNGWDLYVGKDRRSMARQLTVDAALPGSFTFLGPIHQNTMELPEAAGRKVRVAAKHVWHAGVAGVLVTGVTAPNQIQSDDFIGSADTWTDRIVSALADASDGSAPLWNFTVTAFDSATGTLTVFPDCVQALPEDSVQAGDVLVVRSIATDTDVNYVEDSLWDNFVALNQFGSPGLAVDAEVGRLLRILRGTGAGQVRKIVSNTNIRIYVEPDWDTIPDATSIVIVEAVEYDTFAETSDIDAPREGKPVEIRVKVDNLANEVALVGGFLVDNKSRLSDEEVAVFREIFIFGEHPGVRDIGPDPLDPDGNPWIVLKTDQTLRIDTSTNDITLQLLPLAEYKGRQVYMLNEDGPNNVTINCADGEFLFDGNASLTLGPLETVRFTAG